MRKFLINLVEFYYVNVNSFNFYTLRLLTNFSLHLSKNKMSSNTDIIQSLNTRLSKAESDVKRLMKEIASIKGSMLQLVNENPTSMHVKREFSTDATDNFDDVLDTQPPKRFKQSPTQSDFTYNSDHIVVYTDGACENNGKKKAKAGIGVWFGNNHALNYSAPVIGKATNNVAEIQACIKAIDIVYELGNKKLLIKTDSQFVINAMTSWIVKWKKNNWTLSTGGEVKNKEEFIKLDQCCNKMDSIKWEYVAGHKGIEGNEGADQLARKGALNYR
ncbi:ribonuclease HI [Onthophagus taurus]|uniref:ribonuclease HI n=1 Tax=Onthophagus taurus TaxID=166361 RepID=UPI0039BDCA90